jgi:hypothetical protein
MTSRSFDRHLTVALGVCWRHSAGWIGPRWQGDRGGLGEMMNNLAGSAVLRWALRSRL